MIRTRVSSALLTGFLLAAAVGCDASHQGAVQESSQQVPAGPLGHGQSTQQPTTPDVIDIRAEGDGFVAGQSVPITLTNLGVESLALQLCFYSVERQSPTGWQQAYEVPAERSACTQPVRAFTTHPLTPGERVTARIPLDAVWAAPGTYRVVFAFIHRPPFELLPVGVRMSAPFAVVDRAAP